MRKLLKFYLKKRILNLCVLSLILVVVTISVLLNYKFEWQGEIFYSPISMLAIFMVVLSTLVPLCEFSFKMNKANIDTLYSMPIKRAKIHIARLLMGLIEIIVPFTISYIIFLIWVLIAANFYNFGYFIGFYFLLLALGIIVYLILIFVYTRANTYHDGIIFICFYSIILEILFSIVRKFTDIIQSWSYSLYSPFFTLCYIFNEKSLGHYVDGYVILNAVLPTVIYLVLAIGFSLIYFHDIYHERPENISQRSNSWFGYKVLIPITIVLLSIYSLANYYIVIYILGAVGAYFIYVIYQRSFRIRRENVFIYFTSLFIGTGLGLLFFFVF